MTSPHVEVVAHHWILLAVPAFLPAVIVVGVVLSIAIRDRRAGGSSPTPGSIGQGERGALPGGGAPDDSQRRTDVAGEKHD